MQGPENFLCLEHRYRNEQNQCLKSMYLMKSEMKLVMFFEETVAEHLAKFQVSVQNRTHLQPKNSRPLMFCYRQVPLH
jgi:hypothetical protein